MKRKSFFVMTISLLLVLCVFVGCSDSKTDKLAGTWKYSYEDEDFNETITIIFDGMGHLTSLSHYQEEGEDDDDVENRAFYRIDKDYIKIIYDKYESEENYKMYVHRLGEGTNESPFRYMLTEYDGEGIPELFDEEYYMCNGDLKDLIDNKSYPIILTSFEENLFGSITLFENLFFETEFFFSYDDDGNLLHRYEYNSKAKLTWNDKAWDWDPDIIVSSDYMFIIGEIEDMNLVEVCKFELNGDKLLLWWDFSGEPMEFTKQ